MTFFHPHPRRHRRDENVIAFFLFSQLMQRIDRLPVKPPVTLGVMAILAAIYFSPESFGLFYNMRWAFQPWFIIYGGQSERLWLSPLVHANIMHLYYNLSSFLYKGVALETSFGSPTFAIILAVVTIFSQLVFLGLSWIATFSGMMPHALDTYTVGFSGVIFGLKAILNSLDESAVGFGMERFFSFRLPWSEIVWVELLIAQLMVPNASFLGHLSGIIAGMLVVPLLPVLIGGHFNVFARRQARFWGHGNAAAAHGNDYSQNRFDAENEVQGQGFATAAAGVPSSNGLSAEELRQRRMNRFG